MNGIAGKSRGSSGQLTVEPDLQRLRTSHHATNSALREPFAGMGGSGVRPKTSPIPSAGVRSEEPFL